ncbi:MAG TPA: polyprenyl diphosphate synthase [Candidatus Saccharimonadales bacterium]|nr:polyprenyl diphosphate synthase [Candidatus Saccharimonadales bacterium]
MTKKSIVPSHIGLILDGNRRWARSHDLPTLEGHRQGYDNLKDIVKAAINRNVKFVSAYIFSIENWNRTPKEIKYLMDLAHKMLTRDVRELNKENIRVLWLGSRGKVSSKLQKAIEDAEMSTQNNSRGTLGLCFNYGGQQELFDATQKLIDKGVKKVTQSNFENALYQPEIPPIDLLIRTSGEQRTSGFMLYRAAYAELYFLDKHWPDFDEHDLDTALKEYASRQRRFGE